jgi:hypothetical protein
VNASVRSLENFFGLSQIFPGRCKRYEGSAMAHSSRVEQEAVCNADDG